MTYIISRVGGTAFDHPETRAWDNTAQQWKILNKMLAYFQLVFGDSNRQKNAENDFRALRQGNQDFATF